MKPIERVESMNRSYIPIGAGWEIQTKGTGSTFRIAHESGARFAVLDERLHEPLERMARELHKEMQKLQDEIFRLAKAMAT